MCKKIKTDEFVESQKKQIPATSEKIWNSIISIVYRLQRPVLDLVDDGSETFAEPSKIGRLMHLWDFSLGWRVHWAYIPSFYI